MSLLHLCRDLIWTGTLTGGTHPLCGPWKESMRVCTRGLQCKLICTSHNDHRSPSPMNLSQSQKNQYGALGSAMARECQLTLNAPRSMGPSLLATSGTVLRRTV